MLAVAEKPDPAEEPLGIEPCVPDHVKRQLQARERGRAARHERAALEVRNVLEVRSRGVHDEARPVVVVGVGVASRDRGRQGPRALLLHAHVKARAREEGVDLAILDCARELLERVGLHGHVRGAERAPQGREGRGDDGLVRGGADEHHDADPHGKVLGGKVKPERRGRGGVGGAGSAGARSGRAAGRPFSRGFERGEKRLARGLQGAPGLPVPVAELPVLLALVQRRRPARVERAGRLDLVLVASGRVHERLERLVGDAGRRRLRDWSDRSRQGEEAEKTEERDEKPAPQRPEERTGGDAPRDASGEMEHGCAGGEVSAVMRRILSRVGRSSEGPC